MRLGIKASSKELLSPLSQRNQEAQGRVESIARWTQAPRRHKSSLQQLRERQHAPQGPFWRNEAKNDPWLPWIHSSMAGKDTWIKTTNAFKTWLLQDLQLEVRWRVLSPMPKACSEALLTPFYLHLPTPHF